MSFKNRLIAFYGSELTMEANLHEEWLKMMNKDLQLIKYSEATTDPTLAKSVVGMLTFNYKNVDFSVFPNLQVVSHCGAGVDGLDVNALKERRITLTNTPSSVASATADIALGLLIAVARLFRPGLFTALESKNMDSYASAIDLHSKVVGIVGFGGIGTQIAKRVQGFDMKILYHQRNRRMDDTMFQAKYFHSLDEMLSHCDFVVIAVPLTNDTKQMFSKERLLKMKPKSVLINVARGGIVDTDALCTSLEDGHLAGAGLDVTDPEPLPTNHPLLQRNDVFVLPHIGTATSEARLKMLREAMNNLKIALDERKSPPVL